MKIQYAEEFLIQALLLGEFSKKLYRKVLAYICPSVHLSLRVHLIPAGRICVEIHIGDSSSTLSTHKILGKIEKKYT
jgi:hypothetical protein